uniref:Uncharacterized protein n=1 Tax=Anguilla anguilla TaxID=7936 RepID=A0A0E9WT84_ANGAN
MCIVLLHVLRNVLFRKLPRNLQVFKSNQFLLQSILSHFRSYENRVNVAIAVTNKNMVFIFKTWNGSHCSGSGVI